MNFGRPVTLASGEGLAVLVGLAAASRRPEGVAPALEEALAAVGDGEGESWLNLLGVPLDAGPPYSGARLVDALRSIDPVELRLHLLGRHAWSWRALAGAEEIEAAARGDDAAATRLLEHPRYYGGRAAASLGTLVRLDPEETRQRLLRAVEIAVASLIDAKGAEGIAAAEAAAQAALSSQAPLLAIEELTAGYRYVPEPEAESIVLIPHLESSVPLLLAQHREARLIVYRAAPGRGHEDRLLALGKALADPKRVEILGLVARGVGRAQDLVSQTALSRSTVHHHLAVLREAGLVALEGNARAYTYVPRGEAAAEAAALVAGLIGTKEEL
jgi:DNA-binding transcriptional ArsR family regulator